MATRRPTQLTLSLWGEVPSSQSSTDVPIDTTFPEREADALATQESYNKHLYRPNTYLHKWWARRSGTTFRHILKQLVRDRRKGDFFEPGGLEGLLILDPLMGGGTTLHEAIRMGANCLGVDVDPLPVLQVKASLQYRPLHFKMQAYARVVAVVREKIRQLFTTRCSLCDADSEIQYTLYALRRRCKCGEVAILDSFTLREDSSATVRLCSTCHSVFTGVHTKCANGRPGGILLVERQQKTCGTCAGTFEDLLDVPYWKRYVPIVIVGRCESHGTFHKGLDRKDAQLIQEAERLYADTGRLDRTQFLVPDGPKSRDLLAHEVRCYLDLFTPRQLLFLQNMIEAMNYIPSDDRLWFGLLVSTSLEFNCLLCGYKGVEVRRPGAIRHVFSHHAYSFPYTALENNPLFSGATSGTLARLFRDRIARASLWATEPIERRVEGKQARTVPIRGEIDGGDVAQSVADLSDGSRRFFLIQGDFRTCEIPENFFDHVVTDPPYYDSVQYSDLSAFFRVWLHQLLPTEADWRYDPRMSAVAEDASKGEAYGNALTAIWAKCRRALKKPHGRLIFTFHHWSHRAWAELTLSLKQTHFILKNRYVVFSENPISVHIRDLRALKHDCVLVLQPVSDQEPPPRWELPAGVALEDSRQFCMDCGAALGYFLGADMGEDEIRRQWQALLGTNGNGQKAR